MNLQIVPILEPQRSVGVSSQACLNRSYFMAGHDIPDAMMMVEVLNPWKNQCRF